MTTFIPQLSLSVLAIGSSVYCTDAFVPVPARALRPNYPLVSPRPISITMARRPIEEILLELDARGISFPPTATRSELERLLSDVTTPTDRATPELQEDLEDYYYDYDNGVRTSRKKGQQQRQIRVEPMNGNRRNRRRQRQTVGIEPYEYGDDDTINPRERRRRRRQQHMGPLAPADVLFRVVDKTSKTVVEAIPEQVLAVGSKATRLASRTTKQLFHELVDGSPPKMQKGVRRKKRIDDTLEPGKSKINQVPSPGTHDWQWQEPNLDTEVAGDSPDTVRDEALSMGAESSTKDSGRTRIPLQELLSELNRRNIRYSPKSTRAELEDLFDQVRRSEDTPRRGASMNTSGSATQDQDHPSSTTSTSAFAPVDDKLHDNVWRKASRVTVQKIKTVPKKLSQTIRSRAKNTYQKARHSAASLFEDPSDHMDNDNTPIIVDAIVEDITKQHFHDDDDDGDVIDVKPLYRGERYNRPPRRKRVPSKPDDDQEDYRVRAKSRRYPRMYHQDKMASTNQGRATIDGQSMDQPQIPNTRLPRLSPAEQSQSQELKSKRRDRGRRSNGDRTIYSPYRNGNDIYVDGLDRLGDFVANSVDSFLWGSDKERVTVSASQSSRPPSKQRRRSGNWKDKMEEQFDYLLGIHEDGEYYNRWVNEELDNKQKTDSTEGVPTTGRRNSRPRKGRQLYDKPIWEEEGSWLSMLFGTDQRASLRRDMFDRSPSADGSGSVVKILKTLLRSLTLVASGVCRWASVRGSLPQPLVVVGVLSAILSSRPGARVRNIIFMILALRTVGELLHGYINDDTEFWDPIDDDNDEDDNHDPMLQTGNQIPGQAGSG